MAEKRPLVITSGLVQQMLVGDMIPLSNLPAGAISGHCVTLENVGPTVVPGDPVYVAGPAQVNLAKADAAGTAAVIGLATIGLITSATGAIQIDGVITLTTGEWDVVTGGSGGLLPNSVYYLSNTGPPPTLSTTAPTGSGNHIVIVGRAISPTILKIQISEPELIP